MSMFGARQAMILRQSSSLNAFHSLISIRTAMLKHPYVEVFKKKSQVSPNFHKKTTGMTGLFVCERPHHDLTVVYGRILRALEQMPVTSAYRTYTEQIVMQRLDIVQNEPDIKKLEEKIGMGQIEEVIQQANFELQTARYMLEYKVWEPLVEAAPVDQWKWPI